MTSLKKSLRNKYRMLRNAVVSRKEKESDIIRKFLASEIFRNADCIFMYASQDGEISTEEIAVVAEKLKKKTAFPFCKDKNGSMDFYFTTYTSLKSGMYSIPEPDIRTDEKAEFSENSLCIVPGIAFGRKGERLGYGKGYYDRFLQNFSGKTVALSFEECLCENIPMETHDIKINYLFTDKEIYKTE